MQTSYLITGASGLLGSTLTRRLDKAGHSWRSLSHSHPDWNPEQGECDSGLLKGATGVVHLAGEPIFGLRWTESKKQRIRDSRVQGTRALAEAMASLDEKPSVLVCASAVGLYGDRGDERLTESSEPGDGFLAEVVREWESAADPAREAGIRVVHLRLGIVLSAEGGALTKMLPAFKCGLGGRLGDGRMWMSWVHLDDTARAFERAIHDESMQGAYNLCAPNPVRNREFTRHLGKVLHRPTVLPAPAFALKLALGEMAEALLLSSARVLPDRLQAEHQDVFHYPDLAPALENLIL